MDWSGLFPKWPEAVSASNLNSEARKIGKEQKNKPTMLQVNMPKQAPAYNDSKRKKNHVHFGNWLFFFPFLHLFCYFAISISFCRLFFPSSSLVSALSFDHIFLFLYPKGFFFRKQPILLLLQLGGEFLKDGRKWIGSVCRL